jgi:hypothetical protein
VLTILRHASRSAFESKPSTMSLLLVQLSRAVDRGRAVPSTPLSREALLVSLLRKRAAAYNQGAHDLEVMLRTQILWSLPLYHCLEVKKIAA